MEVKERHFDRLLIQRSFHQNRNLKLTAYSDCDWMIHSYRSDD